MSKENMLVERFAAVPLIGMILSRRNAAAGSFVSSDWAHTGLPTSSATAPTDSANANDRNLPAMMDRGLHLVRILPLPAQKYSDPDTVFAVGSDRSISCHRAAVKHLTRFCRKPSSE